VSTKQLFAKLSIDGRFRVWKARCHAYSCSSSDFEGFEVGDNGKQVNMRRQKGFSLIELLIVVAVILIIAAIAIPNMMRARMSANEASAVASMRSIYTAEAAYMAQGWSNPGAIGFSAVLLDLGNTGGCTPPTATSACQIDDQIAQATTPATAKSGYFFTYVATTNGALNTGFTLQGDPVVRGSSGQRSFFVDQTGVIRANQTQAALSTDTAIQ
jgi:prepilin-type N-terminal cleavage/methylation domain-containing protein